jgi:hypothetical protein
VPATLFIYGAAMGRGVLSFGVVYVPVDIHCVIGKPARGYETATFRSSVGIAKAFIGGQLDGLDASVGFSVNARDFL